MRAAVWREDAKKMKPGSCQWCPMTEQLQLAQTEPQEGPSEHQEMLHLLWRWTRSAQVAQRSCGVFTYGDVQKPPGHVAGEAGSAWSCLRRELVQNKWEHSSSLDHSVILWRLQSVPLMGRGASSPFWWLWAVTLDYLSVCLSLYLLKLSVIGTTMKNY